MSFSATQKNFNNIKSIKKDKEKVQQTLFTTQPFDTEKNKVYTFQNELNTEQQIGIQKYDSTNISYTRVESVIVDNDMIIGKSEGKPEDFYNFDKQLGEGNYGKVFQVSNKLTGNLCALKLMKKKTHNKDIDEEIKNEIEILKKIDHPSIIKIFEFYNTTDNYYLVMELCNGGELFNEIISKAPFSEENTAILMYQILSAVFYCHSMSITHRDLKPENILIVKKEKNGFLRIKNLRFWNIKNFRKRKN